MYSYGYAIFKNEKGKLPLHIVEIKSPACASFAVFSTSNAAREYILQEKEEANKRRYSLIYDSDFCFSVNLLNVYKNAEKGLFSKLENKQMYIRENYTF